jgi:hypothetical protein
MKSAAVYFLVILLSLSALSFNPSSKHMGEARPSDTLEIPTARRGLASDHSNAPRTYKLEQQEGRLPNFSEKSLNLASESVKRLAPQGEVVKKISTTVDKLQENCDAIEALLKQRIEENDRRKSKRTSTSRHSNGRRTR